MTPSYFLCQQWQLQFWDYESNMPLPPNWFSWKLQHIGIGRLKACRNPILASSKAVAFAQVITKLRQIILIRAVNRLTGWPHLALVVSVDKWAAVQRQHCCDLRRRPDWTASWSMWAETRGCPLIRWAAVFMCMCVWKWISECMCVDIVCLQTQECCNSLAAGNRPIHWLSMPTSKLIHLSVSLRMGHRVFKRNNYTTASSNTEMFYLWSDVV